jgi:phage FluMu protein Com
MADEETQSQVEFYCPRCNAAVSDPLACGDCTAIICRKCGTPLERADELGIG